MGEIEREENEGEAQPLDEQTRSRARCLFEQHRERILKRTDRLFAGLMAAQWVAGVLAALWISPRAWSGAESRVHVHVWAAVFLGGAIAAFPIFLALTRPGAPSTRHTIAVAQMLVSALLIHLTGGRIETHFHVFGSLAFLAFYRDWRVLISASFVVALDHYLRGVYWPASVYGVLAPSWWRWLEHAGWVIFEDVFLITACLQGMREMKEIARRQASVEALHENVEQQVLSRTAALKASEEGYRQLVELSPEAIFIQTDGRFAFVNSAMVKLMGASRPADLLGMPVLDRVHADFRPIVQERMRRIHENKETVPLIEERWVRLDGGCVDVEKTASPFIYMGREGGQAVVRDISARKSLEDQLRQSQKMEAVGRLAGGVAHDFNNLLTGIMGYSDLLLQRARAEDPTRGNLEEIYRAAERAGALTRQLLAFSRKQVLVAEVLDLGVVITDLSRMLRRIIGEDIALMTVINPGTGKVRADRGQIEQVILNLTVNARDAMPSGGKLALEIGNVDFDSSYAQEHLRAAPGPYVLIAVTDTGIGMDPETRSHIFEPFFTTKEKDRGTGLGLSTVYGIVEQSEGHIWVYSEPGHGTTFKIYLPRVAEPVDAAVAVPQVAPLQQGCETILLVEDEDMVRKLARVALETNGYHVLEATRGEEALAVLRALSGTIHLLLTDVVMPGMNGRELAEKISAMNPKMKILFMSGYTDDAVVRRGVLIEGTAFLQKPFTAGSLLRKIREVLDSATAGSVRPAAAVSP